MHEVSATLFQPLPPMGCRLSFDEGSDDEDTLTHSHSTVPFTSPLATASSSCLPSSAANGMPEDRGASTEMFMEPHQQYVIAPRLKPHEGLLHTVCERTDETGGNTEHNSDTSCTRQQFVSMWSQSMALKPESGCSSEIGPRSKQEDNVLSCDRQMMWGVFDGHRGYEAASFAANFFEAHHHQQCCDSLEDGPLCTRETAQPAQFLVDAILHLEASMQASHIGVSCGTTACIAHVSKDLKKLYIANVGDSRAVLLDRNGEVVLVTNDHKASAPAEASRLAAEGVKTFGGRIDGSDLNITRSIGDFDIKAAHPSIHAVADTIEVDIRNGDALILATDGVWDVVSVTGAAALVSDTLREAVADSSGTPRAAANLAALRLVSHAVHECRSSDNCTALVVSFKS